VKVVIDTNLFISSFFGGKPKILIDKMIEHSFDFLISQRTFDELSNILSRKKFNFINKEEKQVIISYINHYAIHVEVKSKLDVCRDPHDNMFLELAVDGAADYIISGDADLLSLKKLGGIPIISVTRFLALLKE